jgi:anti-anti-sigma factor
MTPSPRPIASRKLPVRAEEVPWLLSLDAAMETLHLPGSAPPRPPASPPTTRPPRQPHPPPPPPSWGGGARALAGVLDVSIHRRGDVVELALAGDLDLATAHILREAITWLRFTQELGQTIVVDTRSLDFVAVAGYRALLAALVRPDGVPDPAVVCIVGPVVARFESALGAALAGVASRA